MLRVLCAVFVLAVVVDSVFGLKAADRDALNAAVNTAMGKNLGDGGRDAYRDANGLAESCDKDTVTTGGGSFASVAKLSAVNGAAGDLAKGAPSDAQYVSCDAFDCPDGAFAACAFKP